MSQKLSKSETFALLAERRRRLTLLVVRDSGGPLSPIEVAERIGHRQYEDPTADDVGAIHVALYHDHLPRLHEADVVVYDRTEETVYPGLNFDSLVRVLERVNERDLPWSDE